MSLCDEVSAVPPCDAVNTVSPRGEATPVSPCDAERMQITEEKAALRKILRAKMRAISPEARAESSRAICAAVETLPAYQNSRVLLAYLGTAREIDTTYLLRAAKAAGKTLVLPRCEAERQLALCVVEKESDLAVGSYGILEPVAACPTLGAEEIDFAVIPCLSFDLTGRRLGQGGGYYDRLLPRLKCETALLCREELLLDAVPVEEHDMRCTHYITERGVLGIGK